MFIEDCNRTNNILNLDKELKLKMRTLNISISDNQYNKFGFKQDKFSFTEIIELVSKELMRENLNKSVEMADKYGISSMTIDEINAEVNAVRKNAKGRNRH